MTESASTCVMAGGVAFHVGRGGERGGEINADIGHGIGGHPQLVFFLNKVGPSWRKESSNGILCAMALLGWNVDCDVQYPGGAPLSRDASLCCVQHPLQREGPETGWAQSRGVVILPMYIGSAAWVGFGLFGRE